MYKRLLKVCLFICMCLVFFPSAVQGESLTGIPYNDSGNYDVTQSHVIINQIYGGSSKTYSNYSFIELYNPTSEDVDLSSWSVQYISSLEGGDSAFSKLDLTGTIKSHCSYLIRCNALKNPQSNAISIDSYDQEWDITIYTKGCSVVLVDNQNLITTDVYDSTNKKPLIEGYVDMLSVSGNDETDEQKAVYYEGSVSAVQSKKKGIRRVSFQDTDDNTADTMVADYSFENSEYISYIKPRSSADGAWSASSMPTFTVTYNSNGGSSVATQSYAYYTTVTAPAEPTKSGYTFEGWYSDSGLTTAYDFDSLPTASFTLYAKWSLQTKSSSELNALKATVPSYLTTYYTAESAQAVTTVLNKINASSSLTSTQITQYYNELSEALDGLTYKTNDVPQVYISTVNQNGLSIEKADGYVYTDIAIVDTDGTVTKEEDTAQIKVRGNSSALGEKKSFLYKFSSKQDVLGMGKAKKWILNANCYDPTLLRNYTALELAKYEGLDTTTDFKVVEVYIDGSFRGCYLLQEKVEAGSNRVDIDTDNNEFILEYEAERVESDKTYIDFGDAMRFSYCDPDEPTDAQKTFIKTTMTNILTVLQSGDFDQVKEVVDIDSFVKYWLVNMYINSVDFENTSVYVYYKDGKLYAGPVWDFDLSSGNSSAAVAEAEGVLEGYTADSIREYCNLYRYFNQYSEFKELIKQDYQQERSHLLWIANTHLDELYATYKGAFDRNYSTAGWKVNKSYFVSERTPESTYQGNLDYFKNWLVQRISGLDNYYNTIFDDNYSISGNLESATYSSGKITVKGYAFDLDIGAASQTVEIDVDGIKVSTFTTDIKRTEINGQQGIIGTHGFNKTITKTLSSGCHVVTAYGINSDGSKTLLGSKTIATSVTTNYKPKGCLDIATSSSNGKVSLAGWAFDQDSSSSIIVKAYVGSYCLGSLTANLTRTDVNSAYGITGLHGFNGVLDCPFTGSVTVVLKAVDLGTNTEYQVASKNVTIKSDYSSNYTTRLKIETLTGSSNGTINVSGWAYDRDAPNIVSKVKVYYGSTLLGTFDTTTYRTDINNRYLVSGMHGFNQTISTSLSGTKTLTFKVVDIGTNVEKTICTKSVTFASSSNTNPKGSFDGVAASSGKVSVWGWAYDPDSSSTSISIKVYAGSTLLGTIPTDSARSDVNNAYGITGVHGFCKSVTTTLSGTYTITVKAVDANTGSEYTIGSKSVTIPASSSSSSSSTGTTTTYTTKYNPKANVEAVTPSTGKIKIEGWAYDPDAPSESINIKAYIGSTCLGTITANLLRTDVNNSFGITGNHGFNGTVSTTLTGTQTLTIKAVNVGSGAEYTIATKSITIPTSSTGTTTPTTTYTTKYNPKGCFDGVAASAGKVSVWGWAYDPDSSSTSIDIKVYAGSTLLGTIPTDSARSDVNNAYGITGVHGYCKSVTTTLSGTYTITIKAVNVGSGVEYTIGSKSVTIPASSSSSSSSTTTTTYTTKYTPKGSVDALKALGSGKVYAGGWAFDQDSVGTNVAIKMYVGSTLIGTGATSFTRSDVNGAYGITGTHGFDLTCTTTLRGTYTVTIKAVDLQTNTEYTIGSKSITIS